MQATPPADPESVPGVEGVRRAEPRQLVVCCDGTNSTLTGGVKDSNVVQLVELLRADQARRQAQDPEVAEQVVFYDPGVGSPVGLPPTGVTDLVSGGVRRLTELALGTGIYDNIGQAYLFLCREFGRADAGRDSTTDEIYLFGFSRGAFTARAVGGMVNLFGLIRPEHEVLLPTLLRIYFAGERSTAGAGEIGALDAAVEARPTDGPTRFLEATRSVLDQQSARTVRDRGVDSAQMTRRAVSDQVRAEFTSAIGRTAVVHFVGVWDTVDSVGILPGARTRISSRPSIRGKRYRHVRHALALDEHRRQFLPRYFDGEISEGQTLRQVWFRGAHSDIGGRRPAGTSLLSWETLDWMTREAIACGLRCAPPAPQRDPSRIVEVIGDQLRARPAWALTGMALREPSRAPGHGYVPGADGDRAIAPPPPAEHDSVARFSLRGMGSRTPGVPGSPWERGNGPRPSSLLLQFAMLVAVVLASLALSGALATPGPTGWRIGPALRAGAELMRDQATVFWTGGHGSWSLDAGSWRRQLEPAAERMEAWARADVATAHASYGWALVAGLPALFALAAIGARLPARAFGSTLRWRRTGDARPGPPGLVNLLGLGYAVMVLAFAAQIMLLAAAWAVGRSTLRWPLLAAGAEAGTVAGIGALLVGALLLWWAVGALRRVNAHRGSRHTAPDSSLRTDRSPDPPTG